MKPANKKFVFIIALTAMVFACFHLFMAIVYPKFQAKISGDLARMTGLAELSTNKTTYPRSQLNLVTSKISNVVGNYDVLSIGDSFSQGGGGTFFQDVVADKSNKKIVSVDLKDGPVRLFAFINNAGILEKLGFKYVIMETVEREAINRFVLNFDKDIKETFVKEKEDSVKTSDVNPLIIFDKKHYDLFELTKKDPLKDVFLYELDRDMFSSKTSNKLMIYKDDISSISKVTADNVAKLNTNLNKIADILSAKGIKLIFLVCPDKYTLYAPYIKVANIPPSSSFFDLMEQQGNKRYMFIDTKKILEKEISKGVKDVYWADDTHWSARSAEIVAKKIVNNFM